MGQDHKRLIYRLLKVKVLVVNAQSLAFKLCKVEEVKHQVLHHPCLIHTPFKIIIHLVNIFN